MLATVGFFALAVFGLGAVSIVTDADIISVRGLGPGPGVAGMLVALLTFAAMLRSALRRTRPSYVSAAGIALGSAIGHLIAVWVAVMLSTGGFVVATAVAGDLVRGGASAVLVLAALIAGWAGIALRRTRSQRPQWPWERDEEE